MKVEEPSCFRAGWTWYVGEGWVHCRPCGPAAALTWRNIADITNWLAETPDVRLLVEFGANYAGFGLLMAARAIADGGFSYIGIEKESGRVPPGLLAACGTAPLQNVRFHIADGFDAGVIASIAASVAACSGRTVIFIDGTDKPKEMRAYAPLLRPGDYLMVHDYWDEVDFPEITGGGGNATTADVRSIEAQFGLDGVVPATWAAAHGLYLMRKRTNR